MIMPRRASRDLPPPLELECLKALWSMGEGSVKDVRLALARDRNLAYTTVMTILDRLARKGRVARRKVGRSFVYAAVLSREELRRLAIRDLVDSFFDGSEQSLIVYLERGTSSERYKSEPEPLDTALLR